MTVTDTPTTTDWGAVAAALADEFLPTVAARERAGEPPHEELQTVRTSGLANLLIPAEYGGAGGTYADAAAVVSELSAVDPNIGALLAYHYSNFIPTLLDYEGNNADLQRRSAAGNWLWGNVTQPWVPFRADPTPDGGFLLNGVKPMNTGAVTGDVSTVLVPRSDRRDFAYLAVPRDREGLTFHDDWDHFGLRRTETVTITFTDVVVYPDEVYVDSHPGPRISFPPFFLPPNSLLFGAIQAGAANGALRAARTIALDHWRRTGTDPRTDGDALATFGHLSARTRSATAFRDRVAAEIIDAYERRRTLTDAEIVELNQRAESLRLYASGVALEVGSTVFELPGVADATDELGLDRYWRDARIHSLHVNPRIYHHRIVGDVLLNGSQELGPSFFID
jgi:alkylation response protein AidB-like acyl-CoA dehydrogenase